MPLNIFYDSSPLKLYPTSYLWLVFSDDNGATWSAPKIIGNEQRSAQNGNFLGCGPGRGHVVQTGPYKGRVMFSVYDEGTDDNGAGNRVERASVLYSDDGGDTWTLGKRTTMAASNSPGKSSEAQIVELPDGTLRMFARGTSGYVGYTDSFDGGHSWEPMVIDPGMAYTGNCMISVINYSQPIDGKPVLIHSAPETSGRKDGIIRVGFIEEHPGMMGMARYTVNWKYRLPIQSGDFVYSCLAERADGTVGLLYEHDTNSNTPGVNPRYREYSLADLAQYPITNSMNITTGQSLTPGGAIAVELRLLSPLQEDLSNHAASGLTISYPGTNLPNGTLNFSAVSVDKMTLTYTGTLPASPDAGYGYLYQVSVPAEFPVATLYGLITAGKTGTLDGMVGDSVRFPISKGTTPNGTVTVDSIAATGETVTVTVAPDQNCELIPNSVSATYGGRSAPMAKVNDTTYTFVMPDAPVTVTAAFSNDTPTIATAQAGYARVKITWSVQAATTYTLYRAHGENSFSSTPLAYGLTSGTYLDTTAAPGVRHWYRVDAVRDSSTIPGTPFQADLEIGAEAFKRNAVVFEVFENTVFDGSRRVDLSEQLAALGSITKGTILLQYRYTGAQPTDNTPTLLAMPNSDSSTRKHFFYGIAGQQMRYEWADGLNSYASPSGSPHDGQWHTAALVDGSALVFSAFDGDTSVGKFTDAKWDGFLSRVSSPSGFYVGGFPDEYAASYTKWVGDIAYVVVSDEVLTESQARAITRGEQEKFPKFILQGNAVTAGVSHGTVGTISVIGSGTQDTVPALAVKSEKNHNDLFALDGNKLVATSALTFGQTYTVEITGTAAGGTFSTMCSVYVLKGERPFYRGDASGSNNFRIPALLTLENGDIMAAIDARFGGNADSANNLDTAVNVKPYGSNHWGLATLPNNFLDFPNTNSGRQLDSTSFIDPAIIQATMGANEGRVYMLVDAFPYNGGIQGGVCQEGTGYVTVEGTAYLALTTGDRTAGLNTFAYYLKPNPSGSATETYQVLAVADNRATGYTTDDHFNLYQDGTALTLLQGSTDAVIPMNVFFKGATYQVFPTSYLWLIYSDDNGHTWSAPQIIGNDQRVLGDGKFLGVGPGRGLEINAGPHAGRILFPLYDHGGSMGERARIIYSDDGLTWTLGGQTTMADTNSPGKSSEAQVVELPDGTLRMYARSSTNFIGYTDSFDGGATWEPMVQDLNLPYGGGGNGCQISVINYSTLIDGKPALVLSSPYTPGGGTPNRVDGAIRIGLIEEHDGVVGMGKYTVNWKYHYNVNGTHGPEGIQTSFAYSCLTELKNGDIAVLYEEDLGAPIIGETIPYKTYTLDRLMGLNTVRFSITGTSHRPGDTLSVELELDNAVAVDASTLAGGLTISYPGTDFSDGVLAYESIRDDRLLLTFCGTLPASTSNYSFLVTLPDSLALKGEDGSILKLPVGRELTGSVSTLPPEPDTQAPTTPTTLAAGSVTQSGVTLSWTASTDNVAVTSYKVYLNDILKDTVAATSCTLTGLDASTLYTVKVVALDAAGNSSAAATVAFTTLVATSTLTGLVRDHTSSPIQGVSLQLWKGSQLIGQDTTSADGAYSIQAPAGVYRLVAIVDEHRKLTLAVTLPSSQPVHVSMPEGKLSSTVTVADGEGVPPVAVDGMSDLFDAADKTLVENPAYRVSFDLGVAKASVQAEIDRIQSSAAGKILSTLLDITLSKTTVTSTTSTIPVSEPDSLLTIVIPMDAAWQGKVLTIYRSHDAKVDLITSQANSQGERYEIRGDYLALMVKKFSTYAVAYDKPVTPPSYSGGSSVQTYTVTATAEGGGTITPTTARVSKGGSKLFTLNPNEGMTLQRLLLDGKAVKAIGPGKDGSFTYTVSNASANHTLKAIFVSATANFPGGFADLAHHWAADAAQFALDEGLMKGVDDTHFNPNGETTRAMVAVILHRMAGESAAQRSATFADVAENAWYTAAVNWAAETGILRGTEEGAFAPHRAVTRQEAAVFFYRYTAAVGGSILGNGVKLDTYMDSRHADTWARDAMAWCVESGIMGGNDSGHLQPKGEMTRATLAVMLQRLANFLA